MHEFSLLLFDGGLAEHWPDVLVAALIALVGYFGSNRFTAMDQRHERAENKFCEVDKCIGDHEKRLTKMETVAEERERRRDK